MAYTTIDDPSAFFQTLLWTGDDSSRSLTNTGNSNLQPDWIWTTSRSNGYNNGMFDSSRGANKELTSNTNNAEATLTTGVSAFNSNGFSFSGQAYNTNGYTFVGWQWKCNGGSRTTFTESGNNPGGGYQANTTAGFSIVDYTGTGGAGTVQHGLGAVPELIIFKDRDDASNWLVYTEPTGNTHTLFLNRNVAKEDDATLYNDTTPTSSVFSLGAHNDINENNDTYIAYCFTSIKGYSKIGSYTGNGNADGAFVYTGFKPAWLMIKRTDSANHWLLFDIKRDISNVGEKWLRADTTDAESTGIYWDGLSNGFKARTNDPIINASGGTYIYMAFAEHPFVSSKGVPVTAR